MRNKPRYWCKQCHVYVRDTSFERSQHEATARHQGNLRRFLRDIHRNKDREERKESRTKREIDRLKGIVGKETSSITKTSREKSTGNSHRITLALPQNVAVQSRREQINQLVALGVAVPENYRPEIAMAGEWQTVSEQPVKPRVKDSESDNSSDKGARVVTDETKQQQIGKTKEPATAEYQKLPSRSWGTMTKTYPEQQQQQQEQQSEDVKATDDTKPIIFKRRKKGTLLSKRNRVTR